jgi:hypothetical protein
MKIPLSKNFLFGFRRDLKLNNKWWHRLAQVIFTITLVIFFVLSTLSFQSLLPDKSWNTDVLFSIDDYATFSLEDNAVSAFMDSEGKLGCKGNEGIEYLSTYTLKKKAVCNTDLVENIDTVISELQKLDLMPDVSAATLRDPLLERIDEIGANNCLIHTDVDCSAFDIVKYEYNHYRYLSIIVLGGLTSIILSLLLLNIYYRGFVYIIFGKKKRK